MVRSTELLAMETTAEQRSFVGCYLLRSLDPAHPRSTYVGFTVNPLRRVRQHNGEIQGGARRTKKKRPWAFVALVDGFASQVEALQFEWAWQHPGRSLAVREANGGRRRARTGWKAHLECAETMLGIDKWSHLVLRVVDADATPPPRTAFFASARVSRGPVDAWPPAVAAARAATAAARPAADRGDRPCAVCGAPAADARSGAVLSCERCDAPVHLVCLAAHSLAGDGALVPPRGACPVCDHETDWTLVVRQAKRSLREAAARPPAPPPPPADDAENRPAGDDDAVLDLCEHRPFFDDDAALFSDDDAAPDARSPPPPPAAARSDDDDDDAVLDLCSPSPPRRAR